MMIDVDESDDDDDDDYDGDERPVDSDSHNETFPGESSNPSKPTLVDLKLPPTKRSRTPEAHLTRSKSISKAIKIVFSSGAKLSSQPPPLAVKGMKRSTRSLLLRYTHIFKKNKVYP
jgi:hypothetical protein